jgi:glutamate N-acetyltransferase/amino-acid N-acetyltransferase
MFEYIENGTITNVQGILAYGLHCGLKKRKKDLALIYSEYDCDAAATFTLNKVKAAPLILSQITIKEYGKNVRAILVNSGNANACTGEKGYNDALKMQKICADELKLKPEQVLISSTGVIGQYLNMEKIESGVKKIVKHLTNDGGLLAAEAIMTTDKKLKSFALKIKLKNGIVNIGGICKGSGMIMPNMATMLGFIATDAKIEKQLLQNILSYCVSKTFNKISVDGETSTNDMVVVIANGASGVEISEDNIEELNLFKDALMDICKKMAISIVKDGEGATKLVTVNIYGAKSEDDINKVGKSIVNSLLVKTAFYGEDANWGRIVSAIGNSGADVIPENIVIKFNDHTVVDKNYTILLDEEKAKTILSQVEFEVNIYLNVGDKQGTWWTCDLSTEYVNINANYRT